MLDGRRVDGRLFLAATHLPSLAGRLLGGSSDELCSSVEALANAVACSMNFPAFLCHPARFRVAGELYVDGCLADSAPVLPGRPPAVATVRVSPIDSGADVCPPPGRAPSLWRQSRRNGTGRHCRRTTRA